MKYGISIWFVLILALCVFSACDDDDEMAVTGTLNVEITDAPVDDAQISGVFITVSDVIVDGKRWEGFDGKYTFDLAALQNGQTLSLGMAEAEAKSYHAISLVLDLDEDSSGGTPGCFVRTVDNAKHDLATTGASSLTIDLMSDSEYTVTENTPETVVIDFDLRKALRYGNPNEPSSDYSFGTASEMASALRFVAKGESGAIVGHCTDALTSSDKILVYAYTKGSYDRATEVDPPDDEQFTHAVTSAEVDAQGNYRLSFLEPGEYELVFAAYEDDGNNATMDLQGTLQVNVLLGIDIQSVVVGVASTVSVDVVVTGILPL